MTSYATREALQELLRGASEQLTLDRAALELARIECPHLCVEDSLQALDAHAATIAGRVPAACTTAEYVQQANEYLFGDRGFAGNAEDYYNPLNSCLNHVLTSRRGIPITLSVIYIEIGRRLGRYFDGVGLPGHFVVGCAREGYPCFIDPFHGGGLLTPEACRELAHRASGVDIAGDLRLLEPVSKRQILVRMLYNLRSIYFARRNWPKCLAVLDLILLAQPDGAVEYRQRAGVRAQLHDYAGAVEDLDRYLTFSRDLVDAAEVEAQKKALRRWVSLMN